MRYIFRYSTTTTQIVLFKKIYICKCILKSKPPFPFWILPIWIKILVRKTIFPSHSSCHASKSPKTDQYRNTSFSIQCSQSRLEAFKLRSIETQWSFQRHKRISIRDNYHQNSATIYTPFLSFLC